MKYNNLTKMCTVFNEMYSDVNAPITNEKMIGAQIKALKKDLNKFSPIEDKLFGFIQS